MSPNAGILAALAVLATSLSSGPALAESVAKVMPPLTGRWAGTVEQIREGVTTRHVRIEVSFDDKAGPVINYPSFKCRSRLKLWQALQGTYTYFERFVHGRCRSGAMISFSRRKDRLMIDREHVRDPVRIILAGPLSRVDGKAR